MVCIGERDLLRLVGYMASGAGRLVCSVMMSRSFGRDGHISVDVKLMYSQVKQSKWLMYVIAHSNPVMLMLLCTYIYARNLTHIGNTDSFKL